MATEQTSPRIIPSFLSLSVFSMVSMVLGLAGTVIITRQYSPEEFGSYTLVIVFASFLSQVSTFGLELSVSKFIAAAKDELTREQYFSNAVVIRVITILLTSLLAWYGSPLVKLLFGQSLLPGFLVYIPLLFAVESLRALLRATLQGRFLFTRMGIADTISSSLFLLLVVLVYILKWDITLLILARTFSSFVTCIFSYVAIPIRKRISFQMDIFKELIKFGYPLQLNNILAFIYTRIDTITVAMFLGPAEIATYEVARKIPDYLRAIYEPFRSVYYPFISNRYTADGSQPASEIVNNAIRVVTFITLLGTAIATLFGREILQFIFSEKYASSAPVFAILMLNLSFSLLGNVMGTTLVAVGDTKKPLFINIFNTVASWLGSILLIPRIALLGASIANTTGTFIALPLNRFFLKKKIELKDSTYLKSFILFCVWGILVLLIKPDLIIVKVVFLIVFLLACVFLSIITKQDFLMLLDGLRLNSWPPIKKFTAWIS